MRRPRPTRHTRTLVTDRVQLTHTRRRTHSAHDSATPTGHTPWRARTRARRISCLFYSPHCVRMRVPLITEVSTPRLLFRWGCYLFEARCSRKRIACRPRDRIADQRNFLRLVIDRFGLYNRCDLGRRFTGRRLRLHLQGAARNQRKLGVADADRAADAFCVCTVANGSGIGLDDSAAALPCPGFKKSSNAAAEDDRRRESASETTHDPWECCDAGP